MKYLSKIKPLYFQVVMIVITLVSSSSYLRIKLGSYAVYGLAFGVLVCLITFFDGTFKRVISEEENWLLFAFCGFYFISIIFCRQSALVENIKQLIFMAVFFYLFTMVTQLRTKEEKLKDLKVIAWVYVISTFIIAIVSFYMFLIGYSSFGVDPETGLQFEIGMYWTRLCGLYNSNTSASLFAVSFLISLALILDAKKCTKFRPIIFAFNIINLLIEYCCIILTSSRGATYSFYLALVLFLCFVLFQAHSKWSVVKRIFVGVLASVLLILLILGFSKIMQYGLAYLPSIVENESSMTASINYIPNAIDIAIEKKDIERAYSDDVTSGRRDIWKAGVSLIKDNWLFGIPYSSLRELGTPYFEQLGINSSYLNSGGTFHNVMISCLASSGVMGFIPMSVYVVIKVLGAIKASLKQKSFDALYVLPLIVVTMALCNEMVESRILYIVNILSVMFWIMMGYLPNEKKDAT